MPIIGAQVASIIGAVVAVTVIWLLPSLLVARLALRQGRSFWLWLACALVFTWVPLLVALLILPSRSSRADSR